MHKHWSRRKPSLGLLAVCLAGFMAVQAAAAEELFVSAERQRELIHLLVQDCGSCHGLTLEGGLGPPLLSSLMAAKPQAWLRQVILDGIPGTAMPPWRPILSEHEVDWLVTAMQEGISDER
ncbi:MAG: cytochrome c [Mariprofundaceae bacterium]